VSAQAAAFARATWGKAMTRAEYLALAERAERAQATAREQAEILLAAIDAVGLDSLADLQARRFIKAGAFLDAALSLVPEGMAPSVGQNVHRKHWLAFMQIIDVDGAPTTLGRCDHAATPALALVAAALRARAEEAKDG
jgi:hypothetical protein